ncbi:MAG: PEGA domain-containing protein [Deltaproteobacteria bacterium]|nr:PEGA domain-containing protein [Deltaproteobacteria bacterium]
MREGRKLASVRYRVMIISIGIAVLFFTIFEGGAYGKRLKRQLNVAVFPVDGRGVSQNLKNDLVKWITVAVNRLKGYSTKRAAANTRELTKGVSAAFESCTDLNCAIDLGKALKADLAILPMVKKGPKGSFSIKMLLVDVAKGQPVRAHLREKLAGRPGLRRTTRRAVKYLLTGVDPALKGRLKLNVSEPGALVYVDDMLVGVSPLKKYVHVANGIRRLKVVKNGFKVWKKVLPVPRGKKTLAVILEKGSTVTENKAASGVASAKDNEEKPALPPLVPIKKKGEVKRVQEKTMEQKANAIQKKAESEKHAKVTKGVSVPVSKVEKKEKSGPPTEATVSKEEKRKTPEVSKNQEERKQVVEATKKAVPVVGQPVSATSSGPGTRKGTPVWVMPVAYGLFGASALCIIGGSVYTSKGMSAEDDGNSLSVHNRIRASAYKQDADDYGLAATVFWSLTGAFAAGGLGLLVWDLLEGNDSGSRDQGRVMPVTGVIRDGFTFGVTGTW